MTTSKKIADLARRKAVLESKITAMKEAKAKTGLAYLIESELEKAEVLLVAKSVVEKLQKTAEDIAKIEGTDIIPAMEGLKAAYGPQLADAFQSVASEKLRATVEAITQAKDAISGAVSKFEGVLNGDSAGNDMADMVGDDLGMDAAPEMGADDLGAAAPAPEAPVVGDADLDAAEDTFADMDDAAFDADAGGDTAAGRAKKESAAPRGKAIREGEFVKGKKGVNPFAKKDEKKDACEDDKECKKVDESTDARILKAFRSALREGKKPVPAAKAIAESFGVDLQDVVAIISESSRGK